MSWNGKSSRAWRSALAVALASVVALAVGFAAPASAAPAGTPHFTLVGFSSELTINGKPYAYDSKTHRFAPFPSSGYHTFTRADPFWSFSDGDGDGYQQVSYATNTEQWGYSISPGVRALI